MLGHSGANPKQLIFEVTEGLFIEDVEEMTRKMHQLHNLGIRFSIDDFGTGYSNLAYLKQLPLYELKIDRSFVKDIPHDANDKAIVQTILNMAKSLKLKVVAEGVENELQSAFLLEHHCDALQGYLYSKPINVEDWISGHSVKSQPHSV
jgi:EAL domain-containing protein (putative c-di-GMP-specific phosphodiesterase class I)